MAPPHPAPLGPRPSPLEPLPATPAVLRAPPALRAPPNPSACCHRRRKWPSSAHLQNPQRLHPNSCVSLTSRYLTSRTSDPRSVPLTTSSTSPRGARQVQMLMIRPDFTSIEDNSQLSTFFPSSSVFLAVVMLQGQFCPLWAHCLFKCALLCLALIRMYQFTVCMLMAAHNSCFTSLRSTVSLPDWKVI